MTNTTDTWKQNADRAMELFERKSPEQLAVELVQMQDKHAQAMAALERMQDQRDQLAAQLKDATSQCGVVADLLRELREGAEIHLHNCTVCNNEEGIANWTGKLERIDAALAGKFPPQVFFESTPSGVEIPDMRPGAIIRVGKTGDEYMQGAADFKQELLKATKVFTHPHINGVFAVFEGRHGLAAQQQEGGQ